MEYVATLVASKQDKPLKPKHFDGIKGILRKSGAETSDAPVWLSDAKALDIFIDAQPGLEVISAMRRFLSDVYADLFIQRAEGRRKKMLLADMDSTIVTSETLDELAEFAGIKDQIAAITARAMNGELDFHSALRERVGLLKGLSALKLQETLDQTIVNHGAKTLVHTMKKSGAQCLLVSGGFTFFTQAIARDVGFDYNHGNTLIIEDDVLTGAVGEPIQDKHSKLAYLNQYSTQFGIQPGDVMSIGDGANDLPMLKAAGLGVGYYPKDVVANEVSSLICFGDLSAALYAQGYREDQIVVAG